MAYTLYDKDGQEINHHDLQDKTKWCKDGEKVEQSFVRIHGEVLNISINPEKETNPYSPDLLNLTTGIRGDLKTQNTPFFKSQYLYGIDPTFAVVFNLKDRERYIKLYPDIDIYYWVDWIAVKFSMGSNTTMAQPLYGVWKTSFAELNKYLDKSELHEYQQRKYDTKGNAKSSYVLDIRNPCFNRLV